MLHNIYLTEWWSPLTASESSWTITLNLFLYTNTCKHIPHTYMFIHFMWIHTYVYIINRYEVVEPPDGQWGIMNEDGNWTGMIGMVMNKVSKKGQRSMSILKVKVTFYLCEAYISRQNDEHYRYGHEQGQCHRSRSKCQTSKFKGHGQILFTFKIYSIEKPRAWPIWSCTRSVGKVKINGSRSICEVEVICYMSSI